MRSNARTIITWVGIALFAGTVAAYALYQSRGIMGGPSLVLTRPADGITATTSLIHISGNAQRASSVTINDRSIFMDLTGNFSEELFLQKGYNSIVVTAQNPQGESMTEVRHVLFP